MGGELGDADFRDAFVSADPVGPGRVDAEGHLGEAELSQSFCHSGVAGGLVVNVGSPSGVDAEWDLRGP